MISVSPSIVNIEKLIIENTLLSLSLSATTTSFTTSNPRPTRVYLHSPFPKIINQNKYLSKINYTQGAFRIHAPNK